MIMMLTLESKFIDASILPRVINIGKELIISAITGVGEKLFKKQKRDRQNLNF